MNEYTVILTWDPEAAVWVATSDDIPGLVLESGSLDALIERVRHITPELFNLNGIQGNDFTVRFRSERLEKVTV